MNSELQRIREKISERRNYLRETYGVAKIGIFGSIARNEATESSDVDILITLEEPIGYFKFFKLEQEIASLVGRNVDVVTEPSIKPAIKSNIMKDLVIV